jgi:hypothetical protein
MTMRKIGFTVFLAMLAALLAFEGVRYAAYRLTKEPEPKIITDNGTAFRAGE